MRFWLHGICRNNTIGHHLHSLRRTFGDEVCIQLFTAVDVSIHLFRCPAHGVHDLVVRLGPDAAALRALIQSVFETLFCDSRQPLLHGVSPTKESQNDREMPF
jgi:hypothetical protein